MILYSIDSATTENRGTGLHLEKNVWTTSAPPLNYTSSTGASLPQNNLFADPLPLVSASPGMLVPLTLPSRVAC
jgi:hypothetical protein